MSYTYGVEIVLEENDDQELRKRSSGRQIQEHLDDMEQTLKRYIHKEMKISQSDIECLIDEKLSEFEDQLLEGLLRIQPPKIQRKVRFSAMVSTRTVDCDTVTLNTTEFNHRLRMRSLVKKFLNAENLDTMQLIADRIFELNGHENISLLRILQFSKFDHVLARLIVHYELLESFKCSKAFSQFNPADFASWGLINPNLRMLPPEKELTEFMFKTEERIAQFAFLRGPRYEPTHLTQAKWEQLRSFYEDKLPDFPEEACTFLLTKH